MGQCKSSEPKQGACKHGESCNNDSCRNGEHKSSTKQNASPEHDDYYNSNTASGESLGVGAASSRRSSGGLTLTGADSGGGGAEDHHKQGGPPEGSPMTAKYSGGGRGRGGSVLCGFEQQETQSTGFGWDESRNQSFSSIPMGPRNDTAVYEPSPMLFHKKPMFPNVNATPAQSDYTPSRPRSLLGVLGAHSPPPSHGGEQEHAITFASRRGERKQKTGEAGSPTTFLLLSGDADAGDDTRKDGDCTSEDVPTTREPSLEQDEEREDPNSSKFLRVNCVEPQVPEQQQQQPRDSRISTAEGDIDGFPVLNRENTAALQQDLLSEDRESSCQLENVKSWLTTVNSEADFFFGEGCAPQNTSGPGITGSTESFGSSNPQTSSFSRFNSGGGTNGIERSRTLSFGPGQRQISTISAEMSPGCCVTVAVGTLNSNSTLVSGEAGTNESTEGVADPWDPTNFTPGLSVVSGVGTS